MKRKIFSGIVVLLISFNTYSQINGFNKRSQIEGDIMLWNSLELSEEVLSSIKPDMSDLRIYGISESDTLEAPYLLHYQKRKDTEKNVAFTMLNQGISDGEYQVTLRLEEPGDYNKIDLDLENVNFDWHVTIEGSFDQNSWTELSRNYRIVGFDLQDKSVGSGKTVDYPAYRYTKLHFPLTNYPYLRLTFSGSARPLLRKSTISKTETIPGDYTEIKGIKYRENQNKEEKQTALIIDFGRKIPVNQLSINISDTVDYVRKARIQYLKDSVNTEKGWIRNYRLVSDVMLSSYEDRTYNFEPTFTSSIKVMIENKDNLSLNIKKVDAKRFKYYVKFRSVGNDRPYYLYFSDDAAARPQYDLTSFQESIPNDFSKNTSLGPIENLERKSLKTSPLFSNPLVLWGLIVGVVAFLGFFSFKMLKS